MQRILALLSAGACAGALVSLPAAAQTAPEVTLTRLDCGTPAAPTAVNQRFSDTYTYGDLKLQLIYSCYLVKHGDEYLLWDTGHAMTTPNVAPKVSLVDLLGQINVKPEQIKYVGISHYHADHVGQVASFPKATLLIGQGDWDVLTCKPSAMANPVPFGELDQGREQGRAGAARQGRVRRRQRDHAVYAGAHARPSLPPGQAAADGSRAAQRRPHALPRELRHQRRARVQYRSLADAGVARPRQDDRGEPEGDRHHPARRARPRQIAGVPGVGEVIPAPIDQNRCAHWRSPMDMMRQG